MVGQWPLKPSIQVRVLVPQQSQEIPQLKLLKKASKFRRYSIFMRLKNLQISSLFCQEKQKELFSRYLTKN